jgi:hypothetical protein
MPQPRRKRDSHRPAIHQRLRIAADAARMLADDGVRGYHTAKRKAAERLGLTDAASLPTNEEIERALLEHLIVFHREAHARRIHRWRSVACDTMEMLHVFNPRAVGAVLSGTVTPFSPVQIHLSSENPESVALFLGELQIPYDQGTRRLRYSGSRFVDAPSFEFHADEVPVELAVLTQTGMREPPLSPIDGRQMRRADQQQLLRLLQETESENDS